jgi:hypothetical protein
MPEWEVYELVFVRKVGPRRIATIRTGPTRAHHAPTVLAASGWRGRGRADGNQSVPSALIMDNLDPMKLDTGLRCRLPAQQQLSAGAEQGGNPAPAVSRHADRIRQAVPDCRPEGPQCHPQHCPGIGDVDNRPEPPATENHLVFQRRHFLPLNGKPLVAAGSSNSFAVGLFVPPDYVLKPIGRSQQFGSMCREDHGKIANTFRPPANRAS